MATALITKTESAMSESSSRSLGLNGSVLLVCKCTTGLKVRTERTDRKVTATNCLHVTG